MKICAGPELQNFPVTVTVRRVVYAQKEAQKLIIYLILAMVSDKSQGQHPENLHFTAVMLSGCTIVDVCDILR